MRKLSRMDLYHKIKETFRKTAQINDWAKSIAKKLLEADDLSVDMDLTRFILEAYREGMGDPDDFNNIIGFIDNEEELNYNTRQNVISLVIKLLLKFIVIVTPLFCPVTNSIYICK